MSSRGKSRFVAYVTRDSLNYALYRRDMVDRLGRHCTTYMLLWIILNFPLGTIFTTTTRDLCVCDVIIKIVYWVGNLGSQLGSYVGSLAWFLTQFLTWVTTQFLTWLLVYLHLLVFYVLKIITKQPCKSLFAAKLM